MKYVMSKIGCLGIFFLVTFCSYAKTPDLQADLVVFSYDRPLQLYAFLESVDYYITGLYTIYVIYRTSDHSYQKAYENVRAHFPHVIFICQQAPYKDFKKFTCQTVFNNDCPYIIFGVDDIIVKDFIDITSCVDALQHYQGYGFFLSLGTHLTHCYSMDKQQKLPPLDYHPNSICSWTFCQGEYDWQYPHSLDMTLYKKEDLAFFLHELTYTSPNTLEYELAIRSPLNGKGLCFCTSKVLNFPLNMVQHDFINLNTNSHSPEHLLSLYNHNIKIDIKPLFQLMNTARHEPNSALITFVHRTKETV